MSIQVASIVPPILTCLVGRRLGANQDHQAHYALRDFAASLIGLVAKKYAKSAQTLKARLARTCLKHFLDPSKPLQTHYGAIMGLRTLGGSEVVRATILPTLKVYETLIREPIEEDGSNKFDAEMVAGALLGALSGLQDDGLMLTNGFSTGDEEQTRTQLSEKVGVLLASRVLDLGRPQLVKAILTA